MAPQNPENAEGRGSMPADAVRLIPDAASLRDKLDQQSLKVEELRKEIQERAERIATLTSKLGYPCSEPEVDREVIARLRDELQRTKETLDETRSDRDRLQADLNSAIEQMASYLEYRERNVDLFSDSPAFARLQSRLSDLERRVQRDRQEVRSQIQEILNSRIWRTLVWGGKFLQVLFPRAWSSRR